jgi:anti-anti-sigma factor
MRERITEKTTETWWNTLLFDLSDVNYVSSAGFRDFFLIGHHLRQHGKSMAVCSLKPTVQRIFEIAMFHAAYPVFDSRISALESHHAPGEVDPLPSLRKSLTEEQKTGDR